MIEIEISQKDIDNAKNRLKGIDFNISELNKFGSEEKRTFYGYVGESMIIKKFCSELCDTFDYDTIIMKLKWDIKTISTKYKPKPHYLVTVKSPYNGAP